MEIPIALLGLSHPFGILIAGNIYRLYNGWRILICKFMIFTPEVRNDNIVDNLFLALSL